MANYSIDYFGLIIDGTKTSTSKTNPIEQFAVAFRAGNVEEALKIFDENNLDGDMLVEKDGIGANCILGALLHDHASWYEKDKKKDPALVAKRVEILQRIISNKKNKSVNFVKKSSSQGANLNNYTPLMYALYAGIPELVAAFAARKDIDINYQAERPALIRGTEQVSAFSIALDNALTSIEGFECLALLLKNNDLYLYAKVNDKRQLDLLNDKRDELKALVEQELKAKKEKLSQSPYLERARAFDLAELKFKSLEKPVMPERPKGFVFGKKKKAFEAAEADYLKKNKEYEAAKGKYLGCKAAKEEYEKQQAAYEAEQTRLEKLFQFVELAAKGDIKETASKGKQ